MNPICLYLFQTHLRITRETQQTPGAHTLLSNSTAHDDAFAQSETASSPAISRTNQPSISLDPHRFGQSTMHIMRHARERGVGVFKTFTNEPENTAKFASKIPVKCAMLSLPVRRKESTCNAIRTSFYGFEQA